MTTSVSPRSTVQLVEKIQDAVPGHGIEIPGRLIGQQHARFVRQRAGDRHSLPLTHRQLAGQMRRDAKVRRARAALRARTARSLRRSGPSNIGICTFSSAVKRGQQVERLKDEADRPRGNASRFSSLETGWPSNSISPLRRPIEGAQQVEQRRLAAAARAHDGQILARDGPRTSRPAAPAPRRRRNFATRRPHATVGRSKKTTAPGSKSFLSLASQRFHRQNARAR